MYKTLVLNGDYTPINIFPLHLIPWDQALIRLLNGTVSLVTEYDAYIKTKYHKIKYPAIIVRNEHQKRFRIAKLTNEALWYRDGQRCVYCKEYVDKSDLTRDHYIPKHHGGGNGWDNLLCTCHRCNNLKGNDMPGKKWIPTHLPWKPTYYELLDIRRQYPITVEHESWLDFIGPWKAKVTILNK